MPNNPYLPQQAQAITQQVTQNLNQNIMPGINSGAMAANGFGSNRHRIAQGLAVGQTNQGLSNSLASLYGNAYAQDQQLAAQQNMQQSALQNQLEIARLQDATSRQGLQNQYSLGMGNLGLGYTQANQNYDLGRGNLGLGMFNAQTQRDLGFGGLSNQLYGMNQNYDLGLRGAQNQATQIANQYDLGLGQLDLGNLQANQGFYTSQRGQDLQQLGLGAQLAQQANQGLLGQGTDLFNTGQMGQQAPLWALQQYANLLQPFTGLNQTQTQQGPGGSTLGNVLGGAMTAAQLWRLLSGGGG